MEEDIAKTITAIRGLITLVETMMTNCVALDKMHGNSRVTTKWARVNQALADSVTQYQVWDHDLKNAIKNDRVHEMAVRAILRETRKAIAGTKYIGKVFEIPTKEMSASALMAWS